MQRLLDVFKVSGPWVGVAADGLVPVVCVVGVMQDMTTVVSLGFFLKTGPFYKPSPIVPLQRVLAQCFAFSTGCY